MRSPTHSHPDSMRLRILHLEDDPHDANLIRDLLEAEGFSSELVRVETERDFRDALARQHVDLVLADYELPSFDGASALRIVREMGVDAPFIYVSGTLGEELAIECLTTGATDYVLKHRLSRLPAAIHRALREVREREERRWAEQEMLDTMARKAAILEAALDGILTLDESGRILECNPAAERAFGCHRSALMGRPLAELLATPASASDDSAARLLLNLASGGGQILERRVEMMARKDDGVEFPVEIAITRVRCEGSPLFTAYLRDITERRLAEHALRESEARFRLILSSIKDYAIFSLDPAGNIASWNSGAAEIFGYEKEEVLGRQFFMFYLPEDVSAGKHLEELAAARRDGSCQVESRRVRKDGTVFWAHTLTTALLDDHKNLRGFARITLDISARKAAEESLRASEERFATMFRNSPLGIMITSMEDGAIVDVNQALLKLSGFTRQEVLGRTTKDLGMWVHPEHREQARTILQRDGRITNLEEKARLKTGEIRTVLISSEVIPLDGRICSLSVIADITDRLQAEEARRESEARFRQLAESIEDVFWMSTVDKQCMIYISPAFETIWGRSCESLYSRPISWAEAIHPEDRDRIWVAAKEKQADGLYDEEYRITRPDGAIRWIRDRAFPVKDAAGRIVRIAGIASDITRHKQLETQFLQAQKMESVGRLAGGVAHDFNNLLTAISSFAGFAHEALPSDSQASSDLEQVLKAADKAAGLTRQLLAFSRQQELEPVLINVNALLSNLHKMLARLVRENITLQILPGADVGSIRADAGQVEQILINLVVNAVDAMPQGGTLTLSTAAATLDEAYAETHVAVKPGPYVVFSVADTGTGIAPELQPHIFEPFFTTKEVGKGTGLGLATVYGIVKQAGGHIDLYSEVGVGTTFKIYFPLADGRAAASPHALKPTIQGGTESILLVEDDCTVRTSARRILEACGYVVFEATDGERALELESEMRTASLDLLVTDLVMPRLGGKALGIELVRRRPHLKVLLISGYSDESFDDLAEVGNPFAFIHKPFSLETLTREVRRLLDTPVV